MMVMSILTAKHATVMVMLSSILIRVILLGYSMLRVDSGMTSFTVSCILKKKVKPGIPSLRSKKVTGLEKIPGCLKLPIQATMFSKTMKDPVEMIMTISKLSWIQTSTTILAVLSLRLLIPSG